MTDGLWWQVQSSYTAIYRFHPTARKQGRKKERKWKSSICRDGHFLSLSLFLFLSFFVSFLPSFLPFFLPSFLPFFLPSFLSRFVPPSLLPPSFLLSFLPSSMAGVSWKSFDCAYHNVNNLPVTFFFSLLHFSGSSKLDTAWLWTSVCVPVYNAKPHISSLHDVLYQGMSSIDWAIKVAD